MRPLLACAKRVVCAVLVGLVSHAAGADSKSPLPHRDAKAVSARYIKLTILQGEHGLWELCVY